MMAESPKTNVRRSVVRKTTLAQQGSDQDHYASLTPEQRVAMVWPLTITAWKFAHPDGFESRLSRHVASVERR